MWLVKVSKLTHFKTGKPQTGTSPDWYISQVAHPPADTSPNCIEPLAEISELPLTLENDLFVLLLSVSNIYDFQKSLEFHLRSDFE